MKARMWIAKIDRYIEPVEIDDNCSLYEEDMEKEVTCPWGQNSDSPPPLF